MSFGMFVVGSVRRILSASTLSLFRMNVGVIIHFDFSVITDKRTAAVTSYFYRLRLRLPRLGWNSRIFLGVVSSVARRVGVGLHRSHYLIHGNAPLLVASHEAIVPPRNSETETHHPDAAPKRRDQPARDSTSEPEIDMGRKV